MNRKSLILALLCLLAAGCRSEPDTSAELKSGDPRLTEAVESFDEALATSSQIEEPIIRDEFLWRLVSIGVETQSLQALESTLKRWYEWKLDWKAEDIIPGLTHEGYFSSSVLDGAIAYAKQGNFETARDLPSQYGMTDPERYPGDWCRLLAQIALAQHASGDKTKARTTLNEMKVLAFSEDGYQLPLCIDAVIEAYLHIEGPDSTWKIVEEIAKLKNRLNISMGRLAILSFAKVSGKAGSFDDAIDLLEEGSASDMHAFQVHHEAIQQHAPDAALACLRLIGLPEHQSRAICETARMLAEQGHTEEARRILAMNEDVWKRIPDKMEIAKARSAASTAGEIVDLNQMEIAKVKAAASAVAAIAELDGAREAQTAATTLSASLPAGYDSEAWCRIAEYCGREGQTDQVAAFLNVAEESALNQCENNRYLRLIEIYTLRGRFLDSRSAQQAAHRVEPTTAKCYALAGVARGILQRVMKQ